VLRGAALVLIAAAAFGALLAVVQLRRADAPPVPLSVSGLHGLLGAVGLGLLLLAPRASHAAVTGTAGFRSAAAVLLALALLAGLFILRARITRRRLSSGIVGMHAFLAISGVVLVGAYLAAG
jgi:hypothetical protein